LGIDLGIGKKCLCREFECAARERDPGDREVHSDRRVRIRARLYVLRARRRREQRKRGDDRSRL
jgi:hypothetical protein